MIFGMGAPELLIILVICLIIFGPKNLPKLGKSIGETVKGVREGMEEEPKKVEDSKKATEVVNESAEDAADADEGYVVFCSKCGAKNSASSEFCSKCGNKLSTDAE